MKKQVWMISIAIYVVTMITFHRFENSPKALDILGDIPTLLSALATSGAFILAAFTYYSSMRRQRSQQAFDVYKDTLNELTSVLRAENSHYTYKLDRIEVVFGILGDLYGQITEDDHKAILRAHYIHLQSELRQFVNSLPIMCYLNSRIDDGQKYDWSVTGCADALYNHWYSTISGKSTFAKHCNQRSDSFGSAPFGINKYTLMKVLCMCDGNDSYFRSFEKMMGLLRKTSISISDENPLIALSNQTPMAVAYLLLCEQTEPYKDDAGKIALRLKSTHDDKYWLSYQMYENSWLLHEIPKKIAL
ncbi:hypothetical protein L1D94_21275 [Vibrio alginolyticus]|uniref:hypothetical protein n=1 Tax=Vibrio alginolyticus TaxID=663 RepID=UPI001EFCF0BB|nr:hypothetical protein [Vibrio alginolyticus]MCG9719137.1 hypothetical protein [Vibrio alginolyticus]